MTAVNENSGAVAIPQNLGAAADDANKLQQQQQQQQQQPLQQHDPNQQQQQQQQQVQKVNPSSTALLGNFREYYQRIFPADKICQWLQYGNDQTYLINREFCFTLPGDVFCRYKSFASDVKLRQALASEKPPEKIDAGAVYQVPPDRRHQTPLVAQERELVFDIDMSDYDSIRSCCKGKQICRNCWPWMASAALIIRHFITTCFGFKILLPVFSGRRGIHVWVCDEAARKLQDDERNAIVQFMTVMVGEWKLNCAFDLKIEKPHPTLEEVQTKFLGPAFQAIFLNRNNSNCIFTSVDSADVFRRALVAVNGQMPHVLSQAQYGRLYGIPGQVFDENEFRAAVNALQGKFAVLRGLQFALLYPRLDEHVSTSRGHLLKLPLCVHPGTGRLCCPLEFDKLYEFDPVADPPTLDKMIDQIGEIPQQWMKPLLDVIERCKKEKEQKQQQQQVNKKN